MADNRSLDEFLEADEPGESSPDADDAGPEEPTESPASAPDRAVDAEADDEDHEPADDEDHAEADVEEPAAVEPMDETFAWAPGGSECAACGATVEQRWRDGDALVCGDCKPW